MREIKFRAWDKGNKQMCYNISTLGWDSTGRIDLFEGQRGTGGAAVLWDSEFVIMQFTGLLDKNGKEIYEGDIVQVTANPNHGKGTIRFGAYRLENFTKHDRQRNHYGFYILFNGKGLSLIHSMVTPEGYGSSTHSVEIIGNIHENPELLEARP